ncbi:MAG: WYL domain-containing protein [Ornithinimicrobium sp.]
MPGPSARLLALLSLLQSRRDWPGSVLADRLEVSERTVRRDVERLRGLGYPVGAAKGPDGGYRLAAGAHLPPLLFDDDQAVAIAVALRLVTASGVGIEEAAVRALATVRQVMPARLRHRVDALQVTALGRATDPSADVVDVEQLIALTAATRDGETVRFDYEPSFRSAQEPPALAPPRRAEPHHVVSRYGRWYLVAWDVDRADWRTYRLDRMRLRVPNGPRFRPRDLPSGMSLDSFVAARFKGAEKPGDWPCRGHAVLHRAAEQVAPFTQGGTLERLDHERCRISVGSWSWAGVAAVLVRFDAELDMVGPAELRDALAVVGERLARASAAVGSMPG